MQEELLNELLDQKYDKFKKGFESFLLKYISFQDLKEYSFMPALFDGWLLSASRNLGFVLYKVYQEGKLAFDVPSYVLASTTDDKVWVITLNNVYQRDADAQAEIVKTQNEVNAEATALGERREWAQYDRISADHDIFLKSKLILDTEPAERLAKEAWILASGHEIMSIMSTVGIERNSKNIKFVGIAYADKKLAIQINTPPLNTLNQISSISAFGSECLKKLQVIPPKFHFKKVDFSDTVNSPNALLKGLQANNLEIKNEFKNLIQKLLVEHQATANGANFRESNLHGIVVGYFLAFRRKLNILIKSNSDSGKGYFDLAIIPRNTEHALMIDREAYTGLIFEFKVAKGRSLLRKAGEALNQISTQKYVSGLGKYKNIMHVRGIGIAYTGSNVAILANSDKKIIPQKSRKQFTELLAANDFTVLENNLNLFSLSVLSAHDVNPRNPGFLPGFFLGLLSEGASDNHINFYAAEQQNYANYCFLIDSPNSDKLSFLTTLPEGSPLLVNQLSLYKKTIKSISSLKIINKVAILHIKQDGKELFLDYSIRNYASFMQSLSETEAPLLIFDGKDNKVVSFGDLLERLSTNPDPKIYQTELEAHTKKIVAQAQAIFPQEDIQESLIHAAILGAVANGWASKWRVESNAITGSGRADIRVTPENAIPTRKRLQEISRALIFELKREKTTGDQRIDLENLNIKAEEAVEQIRRNHYGDSLSVFDARESVLIGIAASNKEAIARVTPGKIDHSSYETDTTPMKRVCRSKRTPNALAACVPFSAVNEILNMSEAEFHFIDTIDRTLFQALQAKGIDAVTLKHLDKKIAQAYELLSPSLLETIYRNLEDGSQGEFYQRKPELKSKLGKWFAVTTLYNLFDNAIALRQTNPLGGLLIGNDLFESMNSFLGQQLGSYRQTQPLGKFLQKIAANPLTQSISYLSSVIQFGTSAYKIGKGESEIADYYWVGRSLQQSLSLFSKTIAQSNLPLFVFDVMVSLTQQIHTSRRAVYNYARSLPLSPQERLEIGLRRFFAMDLTRYDQLQGFKEQFNHLYSNLKKLLNESEISAVVFYVNKLIKRTPIKAYPIVVPLANAQPVCGEATHSELASYFLSSEADEFYSFTQTASNLTGLRFDASLPMTEAYLGNPTDTLDCLNYYDRKCKKPHSHYSEKFDDYHQGYRQGAVLELPCQLLSGISPGGDDCQKHSLILQDKQDRTVNAIFGADTVLPTKPFSDNLYTWITAPQGNLHSLGTHCEPREPAPADGSCINGLLLRECDEHFGFQGKHWPFTLALANRPKTGPILYLNGAQQKQGNTTRTRLEAADNNPAIMHLTGDDIKVRGSSQYSNTLILYGKPPRKGALYGGHSEDTLDTSNLEAGSIQIKFLEQDTSENTLFASSFENYRGSAMVAETLETECSTLLVDGGGSSVATDKISVNPLSRCAESEIERRIVYPGDQHELATNKALIFQLISGYFAKPAYLLTPNTRQTSLYTHLVLIDKIFAHLRVEQIQKTESLFSGKIAYQIATNQGDVRLKSDGYENVVYQTQDGFQFSLKERTINEIQQSIVYQKLYGDLNITEPGLRSYLVGSPPLESLMMQISYKHSASHNHLYRIFQQINHPARQIQRFVINNEPREIMEMGSVFADEFHTPKEGITYTFQGGEGSDVYKILPSDSNNGRIERVIINNEAKLFTEEQGQDILDLSAFELLSPEIVIKPVHHQEKNAYGLDDNTIIISIKYDNLTTNRANLIRIYLKDYLLSENHRHLLFQLHSFANEAVLYRLDVRNHQFIPVDYRHENLEPRHVKKRKPEASSLSRISLLSELSANQTTAQDGIREPQISAQTTETKTVPGSFFNSVMGVIVMGTFAAVGTVFKCRKKPVSYSPVDTINAAITTAATSTVTSALLNMGEATAAKLTFFSRGAFENTSKSALQSVTQGFDFQGGLQQLDFVTRLFTREKLYSPTPHEALSKTNLLTHRIEGLESEIKHAINSTEDALMDRLCLLQ